MENSLLTNTETSEEVHPNPVSRRCSAIGSLNPKNNVSSGGEGTDNEPRDMYEPSPTSVTPNQLLGPYVIDDQDGKDGAYPESVATTAVHGDTTEHRVTQISPHLSDGSLTVPANERTTPKIFKMLERSVSRECLGDTRFGSTVQDDESVLLSSSASLITEEYDKINEPARAKIQYHKRKRLEWKLQYNQPLSEERKTTEGGNSWTVYDDLLEDLEESIDVSGNRKCPSIPPDQPTIVNRNVQPPGTQMTWDLGSYLNQKFLNFDSQIYSKGYQDYIAQNQPNRNMDASTMTGIEEKDDDESQARGVHNCLCRCMPRKSARLK
ncbi:unnamed protein product [Calicophoron daubneyi]|uniref:Uncharacterized protein n=1 Tax=Calicophoron daubneyi TaxID=300641 RepID=A0AAV2TUM8_CALDB